jgi:biotin-dependent carboxylase-like uncharacterized protein
METSMETAEATCRPEPGSGAGTTEPDAAAGFRRALRVVRAGPLTTVQDLGRRGFASLGIGFSGAADRGAIRLANRLVGNPEGAAALEVTFGGLVVRAEATLFFALTGAPSPMIVSRPDGGGRAVAVGAVEHLPAGAELRLGVPDVGTRGYLAVRGGIDVPPVLGSRATDTLAGIGPDPLRPGMVLPIGPAPRTPPNVELVPAGVPPAGDIDLRVVPGPRDDWFTTLHPLFAGPYVVTTDSDRVGMRLHGPALTRARDDELPSEGMVAGALQVPPSGEPVLFLADHPVTGGYPVAGIVVAADVDLAAQARPGQRLRFHRARNP